MPDAPLGSVYAVFPYMLNFADKTPISMTDTFITASEKTILSRKNPRTAGRESALAVQAVTPSYLYTRLSSCKQQEILRVL